MWWAYCTELSEDVAIKIIDLENVTTNLDEIRVRIRSKMPLGLKSLHPWLPYPPLTLPLTIPDEAPL